MTRAPRPSERERQRKRPRWSDALRPYAESYAAMSVQIEADLREMTAEQMDALREACSRPTESNCWWATYAVAPIVADALDTETYRRTFPRPAEETP